VKSSNLLRTLAVLILAAPTVGCSLSIEQILEIQDGSHMNLAFAGFPGNPFPDAPADTLQLSGGTVMLLDISLSLLDYLDGVADGTIDVLDLLIAVPSIDLNGLEQYRTGNICILLDETQESGGTFTYDLLAQEAAFDVAIATNGFVTNRGFASLLVGGKIPFPFAFNATTHMTAVDVVGLVAGTGSLEVEQDLDDYIILPVRIGTTILELVYHVTGSVGLASTDTFPTPPIVVNCLEFLETQGT
jgi:hypothetical protein